MDQCEHEALRGLTIMWASVVSATHVTFPTETTYTTLGMYLDTFHGAAMVLDVNTEAFILASCLQDWTQAAQDEAMDILANATAAEGAPYV